MKFPPISMEDGVTIVAITTGVTQILRDKLQMDGPIVMATAFIVGGLCTFLQMYYPEVWMTFGKLLLVVSVPGNVGLAKTFVK